MSSRSLRIIRLHEKELAVSNLPKRPTVVLPPQKYPFGIEKGMSMGQVRDAKPMGLKIKERATTITFLDVPHGDRLLCNIICKFRFGDNLYEVACEDVTNRRP